MKSIVLLNGSPKGKKSCSSYMLETIKENVSNGNNIFEIDISDINTKKEDKFSILENADEIIMASPLYVDSLPSTVLSFLEQFEVYINNKAFKKEVMLYGIINCGFFEGEQNKYALNVLKNYTNHIKDLKYGGGIGIGGGGFLGASENIPWQAKIKSGVKEKIDILINNINNSKALNEDLIVNINMNKRLYSLAAGSGWVLDGLKNKIFIKGLFNKPYQ